MYFRPLPYPVFSSFNHSALLSLEKIVVHEFGMDYCHGFCESEASMFRIGVVVHDADDDGWFLWSR